MISPKKIGLIAAVLFCAALVCVPVVSAAGPGQGMPGNNNQGNNQDQQGPAQGNQNNGQGSQTGNDNWQNGNTGFDRQQGNMTRNMTMNMTRNISDNATMPGPMVLGNMTGFYGQDNMTFCQPPDDTNATDSNWSAFNNTTFCQPRGGNMTFAKDNLTASNQTVDGNLTPPMQHDNGNSYGAQNQNGNNAGNNNSGQQQGSSTSGDQKDADLISAFLKWLKGSQ